MLFIYVTAAASGTFTPNQIVHLILSDTIYSKVLNIEFYFES